MYCYVMKLLFLIPQSYTPNQAATSIYSVVLALLQLCSILSYKLKVTLSWTQLLIQLEISNVIVKLHDSYQQKFKKKWSVLNFFWIIFFVHKWQHPVITWHVQFLEKIMYTQETACLFFDNGAKIEIHVLL